MGEQNNVKCLIRFQSRGEVGCDGALLQREPAGLHPPVRGHRDRGGAALLF